MRERGPEDDYSFIRSVGKGSYGEVSLAWHRTEGKQYVIKKLSLQNAPRRERKAAEQEAQLLSRLKHPNIVAYKESWEGEDGLLYIVMGFCEGGDLYHKLKEQKGKLLPESQVMDWFIQIAMALQYLHDERIMHRDLKTQNIFLTRSNIIKVGDLGIARVLETQYDMASTLIGTPYYMSPELFANKPYNFKSDVWALGCCVYEMATLRHAFNAKDMNSLVYRIIEGKLPAMPKDYSPELGELMGAMLSRQPEKRPSVKQILRKPFIKHHIALFLQATKLNHGKRRKKVPDTIPIKDHANTEPKDPLKPASDLPKQQRMVRVPLPLFQIRVPLPLFQIRVPLRYSRSACLSRYSRSACLSRYSRSECLSRYSRSAWSACLSRYSRSTCLSIYSRSTCLSRYSRSTCLSRYSRSACLSRYSRSTCLSRYSRSTASPAIPDPRASPAIPDARAITHFMDQHASSALPQQISLCSIPEISQNCLNHTGVSIATLSNVDINILSTEKNKPSQSHLIPSEEAQRGGFVNETECKMKRCTSHLKDAQETPHLIYPVAKRSTKTAHSMEDGDDTMKQPVTNDGGIIIQNETSPNPSEDAQIPLCTILQPHNSVSEPSVSRQRRHKNKDEGSADSQKLDRVCSRPLPSPPATIHRTLKTAHSNPETWRSGTSGSGNQSSTRDALPAQDPRPLSARERRRLKQSQEEIFPTGCERLRAGTCISTEKRKSEEPPTRRLCF
ncbi:serine/threonine-protein kinase Nek4 [Rhinophrynus dorsalis]